MAIKFGDRLVNINPDYALIDLSDNQARGVAFFQNGITESALSDVPEDKRLAGMLGVDVANDKVFIFTGSQAEADNINLFHIAPLDAAGNPINQQATSGTASGGTYWEEIGTVERRFDNIPVAIGDGKTFGKYRNDYDHPIFPNNIGVIPVTDIGAGQGMTALEIIIEALSENQTIPVQFDVFDDVNPVTSGEGEVDLAGASNPDGQFAFGQQSGTVGYSITANNINVNIVDDQGVPASLDTANTSATCAIKFRRRGSNDSFENFVASVGLAGPDANGDFTASGTSPWATTDQFDDFDGFEFKVEITDTLGMTGSATDSIGVSTYNPPHVTFTAERQDTTNSQFMVNESDAHRMPGNVNTVLTWTIDPQVQDGLAGSEIQVTGYQIYRKVLQNYDGTPPGSTNMNDWFALSGSAGTTGLSINTPTSFQFTDTTVPHDAKFLAYRIVVLDDHLSTLSEANTYYEALPSGGTLESDPLGFPANSITAINYYAAFSESGTIDGFRAHAEMKAPLFWFNANISGATLSDGNTADNIAGLTAFPTSLPSTFNSTFGADTLTGYSGAFFNANSVHHGNSKQLALSEASSPAHGFPTTFNNYTSGDSDGNRLIIAIPDPYGNTPSEITNFISNLNSNNVITGFQSGLVDITLPGGPASGAFQVDPLPVYQYRIYVSTNANAFAASQNITVQYS